MKLIKKSLSVFLSVLWNKYKKMPFFEKLLSAGPRSGGPASSSPANTFSRLLPVWLWMYRIEFLDHFNSKLPLRLRVP